jgi:hypothetical protein
MWVFDGKTWKTLIVEKKKNKPSLPRPVFPEKNKENEQQQTYT